MSGNGPSILKVNRDGRPVQKMENNEFLPRCKKFRNGYRPRMVGFGDKNGNWMNGELGKCGEDISRNCVYL